MDPTHNRWSVGISEDHCTYENENITQRRRLTTVVRVHNETLPTLADSVKSLLNCPQQARRNLMSKCFCDYMDNHPSLVQNTYSKKTRSRQSSWHVKPTIVWSKAAILRTLSLAVWSVSCKSPDSSIRCTVMYHNTYHIRPKKNMFQCQFHTTK